MGSLRVILPDRPALDLPDTDVHYLTGDGRQVEVARTPPAAGGRQIGYFVPILGRWFFHADNLPAARGLRLNGQPVRNVRTEVGPTVAMTVLPNVPTGPHRTRAGQPAARAAPPRPPTLRARRGRVPRPRRRDGELVLGRTGTRADITIDDPLVRADHATVWIDKQQHWWITAVRGPVYVDGARQLSVTLREGDVFVVGQTAVTVSRSLLARTGSAGSARAAPASGARGQPSTETGLSVELAGVTVFGSGGTTRLDHVDLSIPPGELVAVVGPSGAGKSSLVKVLLGELPTDAGTVRIGRSLAGGSADPQVSRQQVRYVPQADDLYEALTVRETLTYAAEFRAAPDTRPDTVRERVDQVMKRLGLDENPVPDRRVSELSGGQKRRVSIGLELVGQPQLLLLDEPTSGLDPGKDRGIMEDLRNESRTYHRTVIVVTHATAHLHLADRVVAIGRGGRIRYDGDPSAVLAELGFETWADLMTELDRSPPARTASGRPGPIRPAPVPARLALTGYRTALRRQWTLVARRGRASLSILLGVPVVCTGIAMVASGDGLRPGPAMTQVLSILITVAALTGASLSYQDLVNDGPILQRDWRVGVETTPLILAKVTVFGTICAVLSCVITVLFSLPRDLPDRALGLPPPLMLMLVCFATMVSSMGVGMLISALSRSLERAVTWSTLLAVLQVALNGALFELNLFLQVGSLLPARLGLAAVASYADLNAHRPPSSYQDPMWSHGGVQFWLLMVAIGGILVATVWWAIHQLQRRWRN